MKENDFLEEIKNLLAPLNKNQRLSFGIAIAERMLPAYRVFSETFSFGDITVLEKCIQEIKKAEIIENSIFLTENLNRICPDMDDFSSNLLATAALDAVAVVYELLAMKTDHEVEHLDHILSAVFNIPYMYIDDFSNTPYDEPMMQNEVFLLKKWINQIQKNETVEVAENEWIERIRLVA